MTFKHSIEVLQISSRYVKRMCPVTRAELGVGDRVIVCHKRGEVFSWIALPDLEGYCPYCGHVINLNEIVLSKGLSLSGTNFSSEKKQSQSDKVSFRRRNRLLPALIALTLLSFVGICGIGAMVGYRQFFAQAPENPTTMNPIASLSPTVAATNQNNKYPTPLHTPENSQTPKSIPTPTQNKVVTVIPTVEPTSISKPVCISQSTGPFADLWQLHFNVLGCPIQNAPIVTTASEQRFENGYMLWRKDKDQIYVVYEDGEQVGTFQAFDNQWLPGDPLYSCKTSQPAGRSQPQMGFGKVWCQLGAESAPIGWALTDQESYFDPGETETDFLIQDFEGGVIFRNSEGGLSGYAYILFDDGTFQQASFR